MARGMGGRADQYTQVEQTLREVGLNPTPKQINRLVDGMLTKDKPVPDAMPNKCSNCGAVGWLVACPCDLDDCPCGAGVCESCQRSIRKNVLNAGGRPRA